MEKEKIKIKVGDVFGADFAIGYRYIITFVDESIDRVKHTTIRDDGTIEDFEGSFQTFLLNTYRIEQPLDDLKDLIEECELIS